ncbi:MAG TPA: hypothetical protein VGR91_12810 [Stellaceae bacterium]|nr:hypothetical protein [Stellaceae bacterium]
MTASTNRHRILFAALVASAIAVLIGAAWHAYFSPRTAATDAGSGINPRPRVQVKNGVVTLTLSAADQQHDGILTARPAAPPSPPTVVAYGTVLDAASLTALSNQYLDATTQVQTAEARLAVSRAAFERAKILHGDQQNVSTAELQRAQGSFAVDRAALAAARARMAMVTANARQGWGNVLGKALIDGAPPIAALIARRQYLVKVILPPGVTLETAPATATARSSGATGIRLAFVSPATSTDPKLQGVGYFYSAPAESRLLPGMNLRVMLPASPVAGGLVVPQSAVVWLQGKAWVFLRTAPRTFVRREIAPDRPGPGGGYIVAGLPPGAEIVVQGAQMLLSEEFRSQVPIED